MPKAQQIDGNCFSSTKRSPTLREGWNQESWSLIPNQLLPIKSDRVYRGIQGYTGYTIVYKGIHGVLEYTGYAKVFRVYKVCFCHCLS